MLLNGNIEFEWKYRDSGLISKFILSNSMHHRYSKYLLFKIIIGVCKFMDFC